jgi:protein-disulfide isomerase
MTSGKQARRQRQQAVARPPVRSTQGRKASPAVIGGALGVIVLVVVAIVLALVLTKGSSDKTSGPATPLPESSAAVSLLRGIPQSGLHLGSPNAPVKMIEYIDLQCSSCQTFETQVMPTIIKKYVRSGKLQVEARPIVIIGPDSNQGARAMIAAGQQNRGYTLAQILYYNQGPENGGWLTDQTAADAAVGIPGLSLAAFRSAYGSGSVADQVKGFDGQASSDGVQGTPTVFISKGSGPRTEVAPGLIPSVKQMSAAIDAKLNQ